MLSSSSSSSSGGGGGGGSNLPLTATVVKVSEKKYRPGSLNHLLKRCEKTHSFPIFTQALKHQLWSERKA